MSNLFLPRLHFAVAAVAAPLVWLSPAAAQGAPPAAKPVAHTVAPSQISVVTGGIFRVDNDRFMISGLRVPGIGRAQCFYEKRRGRAAQRALRRILARGPIEIFRTGASSASGIPLVRVVAAGQDVRGRMISLGYGRVRSTVRSNPWCVRP
jgi:hypothetical protein